MTRRPKEIEFSGEAERLATEPGKSVAKFDALPSEYRVEVMALAVERCCCSTD
jgi:hypothetical protein